MVSDFRKKKLVHFFNSFFDKNGSGSIDKSDFDLAIEHIAKLQGWNAGDAKYKELQSTLMKIWDGLKGRADGDKDGQVSIDEWIAMWDDYAKNPGSPSEWQSLYCKFIFQSQDVNEDGVIDSEDFCSVHASFEPSKEDALAAFKNMSKGKANVSWAEFQDLWKEYFTSEDPKAPGNFIFGNI